MTSNLDNGKKPNEGETLKVAEAEQRDVGRKIARVDPEIVERLHITTGDALELSSLGKKTTVLSWPAKESDRGKGIIRIDGLIRNRLDVGINDLIEIRGVESKDVAAGDVRHGSIKRIAAGVGEGSTVVQLIHQYLTKV